MAEFGLKYYAEMRSKHHNILWRVEIAERGYAGSSEEMTFAGDEPIIITWEAVDGFNLLGSYINSLYSIAISLLYLTYLEIHQFDARIKIYIFLQIILRVPESYHFPLHASNRYIHFVATNLHMSIIEFPSI